LSFGRVKVLPLPGRARRDLSIYPEVEKRGRGGVRARREEEERGHLAPKVFASRPLSKETSPSKGKGLHHSEKEKGEGKGGEGFSAAGQERVA